MAKARSKECLPSGGAIFLCNHLSRRECFERKIFGLSSGYAEFVENVKAGTTLFLFDVDQRKLHGVFEATSDGALDIIPDAYSSAGKRFPYQIRFKRIWFCKPLMETEFQDAVQNSFVVKNKFTYFLSHQQVTKLLHLFSSRKRLQARQNPRSQDDLSGEFEISSRVKETDMQSSPNSSSCGSFRSPCQTCSSSTLGEDATARSHRVIDHVSLVHRVVQSDFIDMRKFNSSTYSLHTGADAAIVTLLSNQEDQATDDYIPLPQEEDGIEGIDDLFGLLKDENHSSSESKGSSDSEDFKSFHQACVTKEDGCHPCMVNSKLRSDIEKRKSVFSRIVRANEVFNQRKRSMSKAFFQRSAESLKPLYQTKKQRRAHQNKPFPYQNDGMFEKPSSDWLRGVQALDNSFVWSDIRRPSKFSVRVEDQNKWDASSKRPVRDGTCRKPFFQKGGAKWHRSCDKDLNTPQLIIGVQDESTHSLNFKWRAEGLEAEDGDQDFDNEDVVEAGQKKRSATAPFHQEHPCNAALSPKGSKTMDILTKSDGDSKEKNISLASKGTHAQLGRPYIETKVLLQQEKSIEGCFQCGEDVTREMPLVVESSRSLDSLTDSFGDRKTLLNDETENHVVDGQLGMEAYIQEKLNQSVSTCNRVVTDDKSFESMDFSPDHNGDKRSLPSNGNDKLVSSCCLETEMPLLQKQTPYIQSFYEVAPDDQVLVPKISEVGFPKVDAVLVPKISEVGFPKIDADSVCKGSSLGSDYREEVCDIVRSCHEVVPSDASPILERHEPLSDLPTLHGDSANNNSSLNETSEHMSTGYEDTVMPPQGEHYHSCCGDTSSVFEYTTPDICTGDVSENKNSDQKDDEVLYSVTDSKDHVSVTNTFSSDGSRSCADTDDQKKVVLLNEEQCQDFQTMPELALENSNSVDFFVESVEGCGSKSDTSAGWTTYQQVTDVLGTNSESRTSFIKDSRRLCSKNVEAYAEGAHTSA